MHVMQDRLSRDTSKPILGGVLAGIARYLGWDTALVRLAYLLISIFSAGFPGLLVYGILWVVMPKD